MDQLKELKEAKRAAEEVIARIDHALSSLESASSWGLWDLFGGDFFSSWMKRGKIQDANMDLQGREQYLTPTYKLMLKFQTLDSFLNEQLRISKRNYRQSQANITVAGIIQSEGKE